MTERKILLAHRLSRLALGGVAAGVAAALLLVAAGTILIDQVGSRPEPKAVTPLSAEPLPANGFQITGFRTAQFGMKEPELRETLAKDFGVAPSNLGVTEAAGIGARTISFLLDGLVPGAGVAQLSYVFGYRGQDLIQVSVLWGGVNRPEVGAPQVETAAAELKRYLRSLPFDPGLAAFDLPQPDGSVLLGRGRDRQGRVVLLIRSDPIDASGVKRPSVQLVYVRDDRQPDVFSIRKGQF